MEKILSSTGSTGKTLGSITLLHRGERHSARRSSQSPKRKATNPQHNAKQTCQPEHRQDRAPHTSDEWHSRKKR